jgi:hypothetical protein
MRHRTSITRPPRRRLSTWAQRRCGSKMRLGCLRGRPGPRLTGSGFGNAVVGHQRGDVARKFVTDKEGGSIIGMGFELLDEGLGGFFTALLAKVAGHPQVTGQDYRRPDPIISLACCLFVEGLD